MSVRLPILLYHHVGPPVEGIAPSLSLTPQRFDRHLRWLARRGFVAIRPSDWLAHLEGRADLPARPVMLTFDDAFADLGRFAFPLLVERGFGAGAFVVTQRLGAANTWDGGRGPRLMDADEIRAWADRGIEFGSHSRTHAKLTSTPPSQLADEIDGSRDDLEQLLGTPPFMFSYPFGSHDAAARDRVAASFDLAFTVEEGINDQATDRIRLRRAMVFPDDSGLDLAFMTRLGWSPRHRARMALGRARASLQPRRREAGIKDERSLHALDEERIVPWGNPGLFGWHLARYEFALPLVTGRDVLDVGCGEGYGADLLAGRARRVVGIDYSPAAIEHAREAYSRDNLRFEVMDAMAIAPDLGRFDVVTCFEVIEHLEDQAEAMRGLVRALKPDGVLVLSTPNRIVDRIFGALAGWENEYHVGLLSPGELRRLVEEYFEEVTMHGQSVQGNRMYSVLKAIDVLNLRHRVVRSLGTQRRIAISAMGQKEGGVTQRFRFSRLLVRQSPILVVVATSPRR